MEEDIEVIARQTLSKKKVLCGCSTHTCVEYEINPDTGRYEGSGYTEVDDDLKECFMAQERTPLDIIRCCKDIVERMIQFKRYYFAGIYLPTLCAECQEWDEDEFELE